MKPPVGKIALGALLGGVAGALLSVVIILLAIGVGDAVDLVRGDGASSWQMQPGDPGGLVSTSFMVGTFTGMVVFALLKRVSMAHVKTAVKTILSYALTGLLVGAVVGIVVAASKPYGVVDGVSMLTGVGTVLAAWVGSYYAVRES